jgi:hypothetical protein
MALFTTALGLYGGVLWSGELQGFIIHETVPNETSEFCSISDANFALLRANPRVGLPRRLLPQRRVRGGWRVNARHALDGHHMRRPANAQCGHQSYLRHGTQCVLMGRFSFENWLK